MAALRSRSRSLLPLLPLNLPIRNLSPITNLTGARPNSLRFSTVTLTMEEMSEHHKYLKVARDSVVSPTLSDIARHAFPNLQQELGDFRMIYMDNAATSQKPLSVLHVLNDCNKSFNSTVHRGIHSLSAEAIDLYELARAKVAAFVNAMESREIVLTRSATEGINLVAYSWGLSNLRSGDEILLTIAEHHSAIVPWQLVAKKTGATLKYVGLAKEEVPDMEQLKGLLSSKTKLVVTHHVSHTLGSVLPINEIVIWAHDVGANVLVDACQSIAHIAVDVQKLDIDFLVASSHKMCGPTGIGFLYGKSNLLSEMAPFLGGSNMISDVSHDYSTFAQHPSRFEAGTPAIAEAAGLAAAIDYLSSVGMQGIHDYEKELANYLYHCLLSVKHVRVYGPAPSEAVNRAPLCLFNVENVHPMEIATCLYELHGVAICSGHHCAQPLHRSLGISASARASCHFYNSIDEIDYLCHSLQRTISYIQSYRNRTFMRCCSSCENDDCGCARLT